MLRKEASHALAVVRKILTFESAELEHAMIKSKLTAKAQTTIPQPVRDALRLRVGDEIVYQIEGERVVLTKASSSPDDDPFGTFSEWDSAADREAYGDL